MKKRFTQITAKSSTTSFVEVNINRLRENARALIGKSGPGVKSMAVVKSNAYGHGAALVAHALNGHVYALGVATVEEGITLRNSGVITPILVFAPVDRTTVNDYKTYNLVAVAGSYEELKMLSASVSFHLEFDTGMGRLGFDPEQWPQILGTIREKELRPSGIMTHFATADKAGSGKAQEQLRRFQKLLDEMGEWKDNKIIHAANSGAVLHYPGAAFDLVRFGISLYGFAPDPVEEMEELKPVLSWKTRVAACKPIKKGETVSYEANWTAPHDGWLIVIPVGYSDGIRRGLSNRIKMNVRGMRLPQVGSITMDYTMLFSDVAVETGEIVSILGEDAMQADEWARILDTITYEILCGIHPKIERMPAAPKD